MRRNKLANKMSKKIGRNDPCPCGSGIKYKRCCLNNKSVTINKTYLFSWDNIPGNANEKLIDYLTKKFCICWVKTAKIEKIDNSNTIKVSTEKNYLSLLLNDEKTKVNIKTDDDRTDELITKMKNGKLNIYNKN